MKKLISILIFGAVIFASCNDPKGKHRNSYDYPKISSKPVIDNYFGIEITDEFRNIENLMDSVTMKWFKDESEYANNTLNKIAGRDELIEKMKDYDPRQTYESWYYRITEDDQHFFLKEKANENHPKLYYRQNFTTQDELLYDSKDFKPESNRNYQINYIKPNWDGSYIAVAMSYDGAEISEMIIIDMKTRKPLSQVITNCWPDDGGGVSWLPNNKSLIYLHYPIIDPKSQKFLKDMKSVLYTIGNDPKELNVIFSKETHEELNIKSEDFPIVNLLDKNDNFLIGYIGGATSYYDAYYASLQDVSSKKIDWKPLFKKEDKINNEHFFENTVLYTSAKKNNDYQIFQGSLINRNGADKDTVLVTPKENETINDFKITSDGIYYATTLNGVQGKLYHFSNEKQKEIELPKVSGRVNISTKGNGYPDLWVSTMGWINDYIRFKYDLSKNSFTEQMITQNGSYPEFEDFIVKEVEVKGHDGALVPLSIIHGKNVKMNSQNPTLLYGYGSYGHKIRPFFSPTWLTWVNEGGILCIAHVRGGGEKGDSWYQQGKKGNKPNTWKDLISCTDFMIEKGYTSKQKTVINGGSAGGILIGRAMTERPDLFAVAIPEVGMMNAIRPEVSPNGPNNIKEFGTMKDSLESKYLIEMDAYHHIKPNGKYPATLITTGMNDPRIIPWQPAKFAAKLQKYNTSNKPIIFSVNYKSGHGIGDSKDTKFLNDANNYAFAFWQTNHGSYNVIE